MNFIPPSRSLTADERRQADYLLRRNITGVPVVSSEDACEYLLLLASLCNTEVGEDFLFSSISAAQHLGEANPKIPDATSQAPMRLFNREKLARTQGFPLISPMSSPPARRFDFTGPMTLFSAASVLCAAFAESGVARTVADDVMQDGPISRALEEMIGSPRYLELRSALLQRVSSASKVSHVHQSEKQLYVPGAPGDDYLMVTPLNSNLSIELRRRIADRRQRVEFFAELNFLVGGTKPVNCGLTSSLLAGSLPKIMCLPRAVRVDAVGDSAFLPPSITGSYVVFVGSVKSLNATGNDICAGFAGLTTASMGFTDALRREALGDAQIAGVSIGVSGGWFRGEWLNGQWVYEVNTGIKASGRGAVRGVIPELKADATIHLVIKLDREVNPDSLARANRVHRFGGGSFTQPARWAVTDECGVSETLSNWGEQVQILADRGDLLGEGDPLDRLLDLLARRKDPASGRWAKENPRLVPVVAGYQGVEPPRRRSGLRESERELRHLYAVSITGLAEFLPANEAEAASIYWHWKWLGRSYSAVLSARS
jgi:hypothetical protein